MCGSGVADRDPQNIWNLRKYYRLYTIMVSFIHLYVRYAFSMLIGIINYALSKIDYANVEANIVK